MALKPQGNNILAGTSLAIAQIQSPDFVEGVSGWCIFQNGNAEFNSGTFRGFIVGGSLFIYNGTPGVGTLVASITSLTADPFGNATEPGGFATYSGKAYLQAHVSSGLGAPAIEMVTGVTSEADHAAEYTFPNNVGLVNEIIGTFLIGPGSSFDGLQAAVNLASSAADGSELAVGTLGTILSGIFTGTAIWNKSGFATLSPGGGTWQANGTQTDATSHPQTNIVTTSFGNVSAAWTIPASDAKVGTVYEVEMPFTGVHEGIQLNVGVNFGGTFTNVAPVSASWITTGHSYVGSLRLKLTCTATGSSAGAFNVDIDGTAGDSGVARAPATSLALNGHTSLTAVNTTIAHAFAVAVNWNSSNASQSLTGLGSVYRRNGQ
jgi:hypothetical protein